jgi:two-component system LytT family response regulator
MKALSTQSFENRVMPVLKHKNVLTVHLGCNVLRLNAHDIVYLQGDGNYTYVYTVQGKRYLLSKTMKVIQTVLNAGFLRIHKSYTINPVHLVARIKADRVLLSSGQQLPIARRRIIEMHEIMSQEYVQVG